MYSSFIFKIVPKVLQSHLKSKMPARIDGFPFPYKRVGCRWNAAVVIDAKYTYLGRNLQK